MDQHADVAVDRLDDSEAYFGPAIVENPVEVLEQHVGEFLERGQALPPQLIHPLLKIVDHRSLVAVVPQLFQTLFEQMGLEDASVQLEQPVQNAALCRRQVLPAAQQ